MPANGEATNYDDVTRFGPNPPHGPDVSGDHPPFEDPHIDMTTNEKEIFKYLLKPDDLYDENGTYWADLPILKRVSFVNKVNNAESKREFAAFWQIFKNDPLAPIGFYFRNMVLPGAGLGLEGKVLFSIGNIKPLFQAAFPNCWKKFKICDETWINAVDYLEICGIIV